MPSYCLARSRGSGATTRPAASSRKRSVTANYTTPFTRCPMRLRDSGGSHRRADHDRAAPAPVFPVQGHHVRPLAGIDDGWQPFWPDTHALEPGRTERVAFAADYPGHWLLEAMVADWAAPRLVRWYSVE